MGKAKIDFNNMDLGFDEINPGNKEHELIFRKVKVNQLDENPENNRIYEYNKEADEFLKEDIRRNGILNPIVVVKSETHAGRYTIVSGHRRTRVAKDLGIFELEAREIIARTPEEKAFVQIMLITANSTQRDRKPSEKAREVQYLKLLMKDNDGVVYMDAIHYHVSQDGRIIKKAVYIAIGINLDGIKDVLGLWVGENETSKFWLSVINEMKNRGVEDILIASVDGLSGFSEAINAVFPKTEIQRCVIHQIRNSTRYVSYKDMKALMKDLKKVYTAPSEETAVSELESFDEIWGRKYPKIAISWRKNWPELSTFFKYPDEVRKLIYTTNTIEGYNRQLRKVTKSKGVFQVACASSKCAAFTANTY